MRAGIDHLSNEADDRRAAELIAADPALSALDASRTPVAAALRDPFRVVYLNAAAHEILGEPETLRRLFDAAWPENDRIDGPSQSMPETGDDDAAPRFERVTIEINGQDRRVTVFCRSLRDSTGARLFVLAAPDLSPRTDADTSPTAQLRSQYRTRYGASSIRFLWKTDAQDRFVSVDKSLEDIAGAATNLVGASVEQVADGLAGGAEWIRAMASRRSWSGVRVEWPLADGTSVAPVTLGALPATGQPQSFAGYNGYGLIHLAQIRASEQSVGAQTDLDPPPMRTANVVPLRPILAAVPQPDPVAPQETLRRDQVRLTESELSAFAEIARTLGQDDASSPETRDPSVETGDGDQRPEADPFKDAVERALDLLPIGILVARGAHTLFVNRALLTELGYADSTAFANDGGLARIFMGRSSITTGDFGDNIDAHVETIDWRGAPATMISLMRAPLGRRTPEREDVDTKLARARSDNAMLRAVIDALDGAVAIIDESGRIESASMAFAALFGADKGAFDGQVLASIIRSEDAPELMAQIRRAEIGNPQSFPFTTHKSPKSLEAIIARLPVGAGKIYLRLREPVASQVLEHLAARQAAERANAAKSGFLARISHEIRTPLNAIIGFAEVMLEERFGPVGSQRYMDYLKDIHTSGAHVVSLVDDLLDLSKIEAGKMDLNFAAVDVNVVIAECMSIMQPQANSRRVVMRQALASTLPPISADTRTLRQILLNLFSNAVKFTPGGGQVIVSSALAETGHVLVRVKDTGVGMSEDEVQMALEPYKQIAPFSDAHGHGLGLPLTKALVEASRGALTIRSCRQEGTLVEIAFPSMEVCAAE